MISRVLCTCCYRMFAFNPERVPAQRAYSKGTRRLGRPVAFYPTCTYCREKVEVAAEVVAAPQTAVAQAS
jgi:hypothetical protein